MIPQEAALDDVDLSAAREIRLRPGQPLSALLPNGTWQGTHPLSPEEILQAAQALSGYSLAARTRELQAGFLPLPGGHRMGVCGRMRSDGLTEISSLCVRIAHEIQGVGAPIFPRIREKSLLILGPPGSGKTTLLRDLVRLHALAGKNVGVADERGEIAGCWQGVPQLDVGPRCDVVTGGKKSDAMRLLIRSMSPQVLATDEIGSPADRDALAEALRFGVRVLATVHGSSLTDLKKRGSLGALLGSGGFECVAVLRGIGEEIRLWEDGACDF